MVVGDLQREAEVVVVGGGPGGYAAAFRAADLGLETILVEAAPALGGECLHVGCIPSKALLGVAALIADAARARAAGVEFGEPKVVLDRLRSWKDEQIAKLARGLDALARDRGVDVVQGRGTLEDEWTLRVQGERAGWLRFRHLILATGSRPVALSGVTVDSPRLMDSRMALELPEVPERLLVVGGGYIGLEIGTIYAALGSRVTLVELTDGLLPGVDRDLVEPLARRVRQTFAAVHLSTKVVGVEETTAGLAVSLEGEGVTSPQEFDRVLVAVGRQPNSDGLGLEHTRVEIDPRGFVRVDARRRTTDPRIFAIGDVAGAPLLAHKAIYEGRVAAEAIAGRPVAFDAQAIPAVVFTDPEVAWAGLTDAEAQAQGITPRVARVPWSASGRAVAMDRTDGLTKLVFEEGTGRLLGVGIVGPHAGELLAEGVLGVELAAVAEDLAGTIHTHPTLSETFAEAAHLFLGSPTHLRRPDGRR
ncbi:MAG: dihydrolipoyl dehydrogenase [Candidatus Rokubacteria bacterium]|nr:dihydrolipoyl dehydrogenase [Candidatus Rokubacteria bacterium]